MGGKKKGVANKLAKMSDEERARYLQQRADMEEEARRRKEQLIATFMKNKLKKEDGFLRLNLSKINQYWHQILRKVKCKEMKEDLEYMKRWIERTVSLKNRTIENLLQELEDAEEQYANNLQAHLSHIDDMLDNHREYIRCLNSTYEEDRNWLLENFDKEKDQLNAEASEEEAYLKTIIFGQSSASEDMSKKAQLKYDDDKIEELTSFKLNLSVMKKEREDICSALWKQIASVLRIHVENVDKKRSHLAELQRLDAESADEIVKNQERINQEEQTLEKLKKEYRLLTVSIEEELRSLQEDSDKFSENFLKIRKRLQKDVAWDDRQLRFMTDESNKTIKYLESLLRKGQQILQLARACMRYKNEKDTLLPFLPDIDHDNYERAKSTEMLDLDRYLEKSSGSSSSPQESSMEDTDTSMNAASDLPSGYVKHKIRRPKTSYYMHRLEKRMEKSISQATKDMDLDIEGASTIDTNRTKSYRELTIASAKSRQTSARKLRKLQETAVETFAIDYPFLDSFQHLKDLENLWTLHNNVEMDCVELKAQKVTLLQENKHLRGMMRSILEAATLDSSGLGTRIPTRVCSRYNATKSAPPQRSKA